MKSRFFLKKYVIFCMLIILGAANANDRRDRLIGVINEELKEVSRLSKTLSHRDPILLLRIAELNLEKARLIKEEENDRFLKLSPKRRRRINKKRFFRRSAVFFKKARLAGDAIVKKYKRFKKKGQVYYILAYNAKELNKFKLAKKYLRKAIRGTKKGTPTNLKAKLSLAEIYYNDGNYKRAIPLYEEALAKRTEKWWTKDAYNLAWCYFRLRRYSRAITKIKQVLKYSKRPQYIDMGLKAQRDLGLFYVSAGRVKEAVRYYKNKGERPGEQLLKVGRYLVEQEKFSVAQKVLEEAAKLAKTRFAKIEIYNSMLKLYEKYARYKKHLNVSKNLLAIHLKAPLSDANKSILLYQAKKMGAILQKQVVGNTYTRVKGVRNKKGKMASEYFAIVSQLEPKKNYKFLLASAETSYSVGKYNEAILKYDEAYAAAGSSNKARRKAQKIALNGMLAALGQPRVSKSVQDRYLLVAYNRFLAKNKRSKRADKIYQKVFNIHMEKRDIAKAENIIKEHQKSFPSKRATQEAMLAKIMDYYRERNDVETFRNYVSRVNSGEFKVGSTYKKALKKYLLTMQFQEVEKATATGDKVRALRGYIGIYNDTKSSKAAKRSASYNISILYHELKKPDQVAKWLTRANERMRLKEIKKFEDSLFTMISGLFQRGRFDASLALFRDIFDKICKTNSKKKDFYFKNANIILLAQGKVKGSKSLLRKAKRCNVADKYIREANLEILRFYVERKKVDKISSFASELSNDSYYWPHVLYPLYMVKKIHEGNGRFSLANKMKSKILFLFKKSVEKRQEIPLEGLDAAALLDLEDLEWMANKLYKPRLRFPENTYNRLLKDKFQMLDKITTKAVSILKYGSGQGIVKSYKIMIKSYENLAKNINNFEPPGKSKSYVTSFKSSMRDLTRPLIDKARQFRFEAKRQMERSQILSKDNFFFLDRKNPSMAFDYSYYKPGVTMDRGGR